MRNLKYFRKFKKKRKDKSKLLFQNNNDYILYNNSIFFENINLIDINEENYLFLNEQFKPVWSK
jgi:hypothetical protein